MFRVLHVDDEPMLRRVFHRMFERDERIRVMQAGSPGTALQLVRSEPFDVVVSDLKMPGMDGIEFLAYVAHVQPQARRVLVSGYADLDAVMQAVNRAGVYRILLKPWSTQQMRDTVLIACTRSFSEGDVARALQRLRTRSEEMADALRKAEARAHDQTTEVVALLAAALDVREPGALDRARRWAQQARLLGQELGLTRAEIDDLERGALLCDVGKLALGNEPDPCELSSHPVIGYRMLERAPFLEDARRIVLQHHERYDGTGYPSGLRGEQICAGARILGVILAADALAEPTARIEIERQAGNTLDPAFAGAWLRVADHLPPARAAS